MCSQRSWCKLSFSAIKAVHLYAYCTRYTQYTVLLLISRQYVYPYDNNTLYRNSYRASGLYAHPYGTHLTHSIGFASSPSSLE